MFLYIFSYFHVSGFMIFIMTLVMLYQWFYLIFLSVIFHKQHMATAREISN